MSRIISPVNMARISEVIQTTTERASTMPGVKGNPEYRALFNKIIPINLLKDMGVNDFCKEIITDKEIEEELIHVAALFYGEESLMLNRVLATHEYLQNLFQYAALDSEVFKRIKNATGVDDEIVSMALVYYIDLMVRFRTNYFVLAKEITKVEFRSLENDNDFRCISNLIDYFREHHVQRAVNTGVEYVITTAIQDMVEINSPLFYADLYIAIIMSMANSVVTGPGYYTKGLTVDAKMRLSKNFPAASWIINQWKIAPHGTEEGATGKLDGDRLHAQIQKMLAEMRVNLNKNLDLIEEVLNLSQR